MMMEWIDAKKELPIPGKLYFIADGKKDVALAKFDIERMQWNFLWHYSMFKPKFFIRVALPSLPKGKEEE